MVTPYFIYDEDYKGVNIEDIASFEQHEYFNNYCKIFLKSGRITTLKFSPKDFCELLNMTK